jgi:hypothetical protein
MTENNPKTVGELKEFLDKFEDNQIVIIDLDIIRHLGKINFAYPGGGKLEECPWLSSGEEDED